MKHLHLMFLAGAGGVGKSTTAEALMRLVGNARGQSDNVPGSTYARYVPSTTRASLASVGTRSEAAAIDNTEEFRVAKQALVRQNYRDNLETEIKNFVGQAAGRIHDRQLLIIDRSPFDHVAYSLVDIPTLTLAEISTLTAKAAVALHGLARAVGQTAGFLATYTTSIVLFDYPTPWATQGKDEPDGFRVSSAMNARNYVWAKTLKCLIDDEIAASRGMILSRTFRSDNFDSVEQRADACRRFINSKRMYDDSKDL